MKKSQSGFTLIELVVVIVLLGILGVTALGKFQNLSASAADAQEQGIAAELSSAAAINFAAKSVGVAGAIDIKTASCAAADLGELMASGAVPTTADLGYAFVDASWGGLDGSNCTVAGDTFNCSIINAKGSDLVTGATATIICTAPGP